jgi:deoxyribodipyrimidine photo-lyase
MIFMQDSLSQLNKVDSIGFTTDYNLILERIQNIDPIKYAATRNYLNGSITYLSPYISRGVISCRQVMDSILNKGYKPFEIEKLIQELAWREYYQRIWQCKKELIWQDLKQAQPDTVHNHMVAAVQNAKTGIEVIDDQINELFATGYLHNHVRMYLASITCNIAKAHWLQPSKWLYYHLLDGDIASNNCSWQWVAGAFASKKYYCNQENINRYTFANQSNTFLDKPYEELASMNVPEILMGTSSLQLRTNLPTTELPIIDSTKKTLMYNAYNIDPEWRKQEAANRVLLLEPSHFNKYPVSEKLIDFIINLSKNIPGIQVYCGEIADIEGLYLGSNLTANENIISKEHPAFDYYLGTMDAREWMFPAVTGYYPSFFSYWKKCAGYLQDLI